MPDDRRRRSPSRGRKKSKRQASSASRSRSPAAKRRSGRDEERRPSPPAKRDSGAGRRRTEAPPKKKNTAAAAASEEEDSEDDAGSSGGESEAPKGGDLEERVALLEVENAALKAENRELKKKLVEFVRKGAAGGKDRKAAAPASKKPGQASPPRPRSPTPEKPPPKAADAGPQDRRARLAAAAAEAPSDRAAQRRRTNDETQAQANNDADARNAVMLVNAAIEAYNLSVPNNIPPEKRLPMVEEKLGHFMNQFSDKIQILDLKSGGAVIKDKKTFTMRYSCVFRESGAKLKGTTHKRFYFDASGGKPTYSLDFETHESLVTATPGTPQDGKLGVRDPRTEHLAVLYEEKGSKITRMWLRPDAEKLGIDPTAGEDVMKRTAAYKAFEEKIKEVKGGPAGEFYFFNYHETPTVG